MNIKKFFLFVCFSLYIASPIVPAAAQPQLTIYTYSSFASEWGPAPKITPIFESMCACRIVWVSLDDAVSLLSRLKLEGQHTKADIVLGLDQTLLSLAKGLDLFAPHETNTQYLNLPITWQDTYFLPFDYGYMAFVYDKTKITPQNPISFQEFIANTEEKIIIQDPRTSSVGLGFLRYVHQVSADEKAALTQIAKKTLTTTKGWSEAYQLFLKGEAPYVWSYTTSPFYHQFVEHDDNYRALQFTEGHPLQVEVAGLIKTSKNQALAKQFFAFMLSREFQQFIPVTQYMYPVIDLKEKTPQGFATLPKPDIALDIEASLLQQQKSIWLKNWLNAYTQ